MLKLNGHLQNADISRMGHYTSACVCSCDMSQQLLLLQTPSKTVYVNSCYKRLCPVWLEGGIAGPKEVSKAGVDRNNKAGTVNVTEKTEGHGQLKFDRKVCLVQLRKTHVMCVKHTPCWVSTSASCCGVPGIIYKSASCGCRVVDVLKRCSTSSKSCCCSFRPACLACMSARLSLLHECASACAVLTDNLWCALCVLLMAASRFWRWK